MRKVMVAIFAALALWSCGGDRDAMRERLDYVSQCNRADTVFTEAWLPTVDSLVCFFDRHGNANERMMAHYLQGRVHHDMGEAPIALECYQKATEMADTTRKDCDLHTLAAIYGQMADLFHLQYLPDDEMAAIKMAEHFNWKNKDTLTAIINYRIRTRVYHLRCDTDSMLYITDKCIETYHKLGRNDLAAQLLLVPISVCLDRGQYEKAWKYIQVHEKESGFFDGKGNAMPGKELFFYYKGLCLLSQNQSDAAVSCFKKALSGGFLEAGYKGLLSAYEQKRIPDSIAKYGRLYATGNDSTFMHVNQERVRQVTAMYGFSRLQRMAEQNKLKATRMRLYLLLFALSSTAIIATCAYFVKKARAKSMLRINELLSAKRDLQDMLDEKQAQIAAFSSEKEIEIERINQESAKLLETHLEEQARLQMEIEKLNVEIEKLSSLDMEKAFYKSAIGIRFQQIRDNYPKHSPPSSLDWARFAKSFREHFNYYYTFITDGNRLSADQLRICMMLRLNFHEYEMAHFMNTDNQRINRVKQQVNKKLFGESNSMSLRDNLKAHFWPQGSTRM